MVRLVRWSELSCLETVRVEFAQKAMRTGGKEPWLAVILSARRRISKRCYGQRAVERVTGGRLRTRPLCQRG